MEGEDLSQLITPGAAIFRAAATICLTRMIATRVMSYQIQAMALGTLENTTLVDRYQGNVSSDGKELYIILMEVIDQSLRNDNLGEKEADLDHAMDWGSWIHEVGMGRTTNMKKLLGHVMGGELLPPVRRVLW